MYYQDLETLPRGIQVILPFLGLFQTTISIQLLKENGEFFVT